MDFYLFLQSDLCPAKGNHVYLVYKRLCMNRPLLVSISNAGLLLPGPLTIFIHVTLLLGNSQLNQLFILSAVIFQKILFTQDTVFYASSRLKRTNLEKHCRIIFLYYRNNRNLIYLYCNRTLPNHEGTLMHILLQPISLFSIKPFAENLIQL